MNAILQELSDKETTEWDHWTLTANIVHNNRAFLSNLEQKAVNYDFSVTLAMLDHEVRQEARS